MSPATATRLAAAVFLAMLALTAWVAAGMPGVR